MPIYEFFCQPCNTIFNFYSKRIDTLTTPRCPSCGQDGLQRQVSLFATIGKAKEEDDQFAGLDENKMEQALESLMRESSGINEDDPRQMAGLMRKFSERTGINLGENMEEAIARMERGEDPEQIEQEMGDMFDGDDFSFEALKKKALSKSARPRHDETLYDLHPDETEK
jgi:putative FmdB family regulatory protein